ncbi:DEAD/DEAH box helicase [Bacteriovorax sp. BAL6_X]|uniref:DEAD/DEAH box helicase n=1 Tax=Bacteriovorax sp. BAL6_X TaxID=1201290 RepID=UPI000386B9F1|nr:DEAD/DEAH box helicase [Bacteriovorax sp. BAL6_X]EPZ51955.1 DEAD/DEAH box helicase [Bacteriovorax sp. BAL6_X]
MTCFRSLNLSASTLNALEKIGFKVATPIQEKSIPALLEGRDLLGIAQTGTGKTAAFSLPIIERLNKNRKEIAPNHCRAIILAPTRELATQINDSVVSFAKGTKITSVLIIGGVSNEPQKKSMSLGADIVIATPGRFIDLMNDGIIKVSHAEFFVLDEADMMLDMGFYEGVNDIANKAPDSRQTILLSATMPKQIEKLANSILKNPIKVEITPESSTVDKIKQSVYFTLAENKNFLLLSLLEDQTNSRILIFCKAKYAVAEIVELLNRSEVSVGEIHSNLTQGQRNQSIEDFTNGKIRVLVATDIASRGIDIDAVDMVINYNMPEDATYYVHRIGRTARAQREGSALSLCSEKDLPFLRNVEKLIGLKISRVTDHPFHHDYPVSKPKSKRRFRGRRRR